MLWRCRVHRVKMAVPDDKITDFIAAMQRIYHIPTAPSDKNTTSWTPPPATAGHRGRYLWTDAFGVLNLITLSRVTPHRTHYISLASTLVSKVHSILGRTRDQSSRLPGATDENPLGGGLRIGKEHDSGSDGDGQYHHYLTLWMFALNRLSVASAQPEYNDMAISLARAIHPAFVYQRSSSRPRMYWKVSMDLSHPLVHSEGNLDPVDGYVVFTLLQRTNGEGSTVLQDEIRDYEKIVQTKWQGYSSSDPLDLGMTLWTAHWLAGEEEHPWAGALLTKAKSDTMKLFDSGYFDRDIERRLAFREFGTALGIRCQCEDQDGWVDRADTITTMWRDAGLLEGGWKSRVNTDHDLAPITLVMYAAALVPGAFQKSFL
ncbi:hypothetical protein VM1G_08256 [Cytospora mali]|uniref:Uncharacterized protein n=1 Tax=Cytospora mali TaxID=578113 RepID=A0A194W904_CYTMA|nr:hypothetical protein VM1G_08256 [Valsa mali]